MPRDELTSSVVDLPGLAGFDATAIVATGLDRHLVVVRSFAGDDPVVALADGQLDRRYGNEGRAGLSGLLGNSRDAALAPDGGLAVLLNRPEGPVVARLNPQGTLDETFGEGGVVQLPFGASSIAFGADGRLHAAGDRVIPGVQARPALGTLTPTGVVDPGFRAAALERLAAQGATSIIDVAVRDGRVGIVTTKLGRSRRAFAMVLADNGQTLPGATDEPATLGWGRTAILVNDLVRPQVRFDGRGRLAMLASVRRRGGRDFFFALARLHPRGTLDRTFEGDGHLLLRSPRGRNRLAGDLIVRDDGTLIAVGAERVWLVRRERGERLTRTRLLLVNREPVRRHRARRPDHHGPDEPRWAPSHPGPTGRRHRATIPTMTTRERLHQLVDELPDGDADRALRALERWRDDPVSLVLEAAPYDDEPETPDERAAVERARGEVRRGEVVAAEEVWGGR